MHAIDKTRRMDDTKLLWHKEAVYRRFVCGERIPPIHIDMGIAKFCNIKCVFCYGMYQQKTKEMIQRPALLQAMRDAGSIGIRSIGFIGDGEPTCNPAVWDALRVARQSGLDMAISTNGAAITTDDRRAAILENCVWMRFCFSAGTREGYKRIHGVDAFDHVVKNISDLVRYRDTHGLKCEIGLQAVFVPTIMLTEILEEAKLAVSIGVDYMVIKQCSLPDYGQTGMAQFDMKEYDTQRVKDTLAACQAMSTERTEIVPKWNLIAQKGDKPYDNCPAISLISSISGNGDWFPCGYMFGNDKPQFARYRFGNIHEKSLKEIWESDRYWTIIDEMEAKFDPAVYCKGACRQDKCNEWIHNYLKLSLWGRDRMREMIPAYTPKGVNFI